MDDYELARVVGRIHFPDDSTTPSLDIASAEEPVAWEPSVFVGDVRLSEFRKILQAEGIQAEFKGEGILVCNDQVAVRKVSKTINERMDGLCISLRLAQVNYLWKVPYLWIITRFVLYSMLNMLFCK